MKTAVMKFVTTSPAICACVVLASAVALAQVAKIEAPSAITFRENNNQRIAIQQKAAIPGADLLKGAAGVSTTALPNSR